jgi:hypothetical protein
MPAPDRTRSNIADDAPAAAAAMIGVRRRSDYEYLGMPLWCIATGPDPARNEMRVHEMGVIAIGDIATGVIAIGGLARGFLAIGGLATGLIAIGGFALGGLAFGGLAIGMAALGGGAIGWVAVGGAAAGYYAAGGAAFGTYTISALGQSPEAVEFFTQWDALRAMLPTLRRR